MRLDDAPPAYAYDRAVAPVAVVEPGAVVVARTRDARDGALADRPVDAPFVLPPPPTGRGNPLVGPIAVRGAAPGDALAVDVLAIACGSPGWVGAHAHVNPLAPGRIPEALGRAVTVREGVIEYGAGIALPLAPMLGCLGTAPADGAPGAGVPGRHGGNLDHPIVAPGARVYLPVAVADGLLFVGDVHAAQGDGELSSVAVEVPAEVTLRVDTVPDLALGWPWVETADRIAVLVAARDFTAARREAVEAMVGLVERQLGFAPGDALALISACGDLRIGQAFGGDLDMTVRLELPRLPGLTVR